MQAIEEIEKAYETPDPWGFTTNPDDAVRKKKIIQACMDSLPKGRNNFFEALEIGAGEGWITQDLPALKKHGFEVSANARARMPAEVMPRLIIQPREKFDLIVVPGVLYAHYDCGRFFEILRDNATQIIVTCNIKTWEHQNMENIPWLLQVLGLEEIHEEEFLYREFTQKLRVFRVVA